jgi:hypothetical protein
MVNIRRGRVVSESALAAFEAWLRVDSSARSLASRVPRDRKRTQSAASGPTRSCQPSSMRRSVTAAFSSPSAPLRRRVQPAAARRLWTSSPHPSTPPSPGITLTQS